MGGCAEGGRRPRTAAAAGGGRACPSRSGPSPAAPPDRRHPVRTARAGGRGGGWTGGGGARRQLRVGGRAGRVAAARSHCLSPCLSPSADAPATRHRASRRASLGPMVGGGGGGEEAREEGWVETERKKAKCGAEPTFFFTTLSPFLPLAVFAMKYSTAVSSSRRKSRKVGPPPLPLASGRARGAARRDGSLVSEKGAGGARPPPLPPSPSRRPTSGHADRCSPLQPGNRGAWGRRRACARALPR